MAINNNINIIVSAVDKTTAPLKKMGGQFSSFAKNVEWSIWWLIEPLKQVWIGLLWVWGYGLKLAWDLEQTRVSFETMLWSADQAKKLLWELSDFAATTPFEFPEIANAWKSLLAFGFEADKIQENLRMLWDIASGLNIPFWELSEIYGKIQVQWRLYQEDINQLTWRGIPIIWELAKQFWVTEWEVKKLVETWKIWFPEIQTAFQNLTSEGGKFEGMMLKQSETLNGTLSTLRDNLKMTLLEIIWVNKEWEIATWSLIERSKEMVATLSSSLEANKEEIKTFWEIIIFVLSQIWTFIKEAVLTPLYQIWWALGWVTAQVVIFAQKIPELLSVMKQAMLNIFNAIQEAFISTFTYMWDFITEKIQWVINFANNALNWIKWVFNSIMSVKENIANAVWWAVDKVSWARALWGTVSAGKTYLVGEKWPELFTPSTMWSIATNKSIWWGAWNITINMWGVTVSNEADENRLVEKIQKTLTRQMQLWKLWIL